ncbi:hypothetical protein ACFQZI_05855 [Mucilaginibacter lutimaris]|uniref:Lipoprotein n=1 Tax=Mucilaginibacter lutimaris TaxID=931629 RepID=A0ABW2ZDV1_9SPHI
MKKTATAILITTSVLLLACKGNPQGAMGANDKPDTTAAFDKQDPKNGRPEATKGDSTGSSVGPGNDKTHATDSEDKQKHR